MRVALAAMLFSEPDLLLLDEPTNYLDLEGTLWLERYLSRYRHTVDRHQPRPRPLEHGGQLHRAPDRPEADVLARRLRFLRAAVPRAADPAGQTAREAGGRAQAHAGLRRPLPRQGVEGAAGTVAAEGARQAPADRRGGRGQRAALPLSEPGAEGGAADRAHGGRIGRLRAGPAGALAARSAHRRRRPDRAARRQRQRQVDLRQARCRIALAAIRRDDACAKAAHRVFRTASDRGAAAGGIGRLAPEGADAGRDRRRRSARTSRRSVSRRRR